MAPSVAQAQVAAEELAGIDLQYEAPVGCPERDAFVKNLEARRRGAPPGTATDTVRLEVRLELSERAAGSIAVTSRGGARSARRVEAATCAEAADALAFIAALALVGVQVEPEPAVARSNRATDQADKRASRARATDQPLATEVTPPDEAVAPVADVKESTAATETETEPQVASVTEQAEQAEPEEDDGDERAAQRTTRAHLMLAGGAGLGVLPAVQPLLELSLSVEAGGDGELLLSAQAGVRVAPDQTRSFDMGVVTFGWWSGLGSLCAGARGARLAASGCAMVEVGAVAASATETDRPQDELRAWLAVGPGLSLVLDASEALRLQLRAEALLPLARYRFELPRESAVHEPAQVGLRVGLGVGLRLW